jgi:hypothetical protein
VAKYQRKTQGKMFILVYSFRLLSPWSSDYIIFRPELRQETWRKGMVEEIYSHHGSEKARGRSQTLDIIPKGTASRAHLQGCPISARYHFLSFHHLPKPIKLRTH